MIPFDFELYKVSMLIDNKSTFNFNLKIKKIKMKMKK
jgi:hypothetical protein